MARARLSALLLLVAGCAQTVTIVPPPQGQFYYPTGVAFVPSQTPGGKGVLLVANSNFDLRFGSGSLMALDLSQLQLPTRQQTQGIPQVIKALPITQESSIALMDSFAGQVVVWQDPSHVRAFVPTRQENRLVSVDVRGTELSCVDPASSDPRNCLHSSLKLQTSDQVRAQDPYGATVFGNNVYVTHLSAADFPAGSLTNQQSYLAIVPAADPHTVDLRAIGVVPSQGVAVAGDSVFLAGRALPTQHDPLRQILVADPSQVTSVTLNVASTDLRGLVVSSDGKRLYAAARDPDELLVIDPSLKTGPVIRNIIVPKGPTEVAVLKRPGKRDLIAVSCTTDDVVVLYDDETGLSSLANTVGNVGSAPTGLAVSDDQTKIFVSSFNSGTLSVIDLDPNQPNLAEVVAILGTPQICITEPQRAECQ